MKEGPDPRGLPALPSRATLRANTSSDQIGPTPTSASGLDYYPAARRRAFYARPRPSPAGARLTFAHAVAHKAMEQFAAKADLSSAHLLFIDELTWRPCARSRLDGAQRRAVPLDQPGEPEPYADFCRVPPTMQQSEKRKKIQQER